MLLKVLYHTGKKGLSCLWLLNYSIPHDLQELDVNPGVNGVIAYCLSKASLVLSSGKGILCITSCPKLSCTVATKNCCDRMQGRGGFLGNWIPGALGL